MKKSSAAILAFALLAPCVHGATSGPLRLSQAEYEDRVGGAWIGQIIGTLIGFQFEGKPASSTQVFADQYPMKFDAAQVDDDYYYGGYDEPYDEGFYEGNYEEGGAAVYRTLPCAPNSVAMGGTIYYVCGSTWYVPAYSDGELVYVVVDSPTGH